MSTKSLKNRISSVKNISQITRAMEAVSAVKMRKSQMLALLARPYAMTAIQVLKNLSAGVGGDISNLSPLLVSPKRTREVGLQSPKSADKILLAVVASDKGLAGAFNANVFRHAERFIKTCGKPVEIVAVGKKTKNYFVRRSQKLPIIAEFFESGDFASLEETEPLAEFLLKSFAGGQYEKVSIIYSNFISSLRQEPISRTVLPIDFSALEEIAREILPERGKYANVPSAFLETGEAIPSELIFEPSPKEVLEKILPELVKVEIYSCVLEANASEHSSRMLAMKNASDNAKDLASELTLSFNKTRQAAITKELTEISAGTNAQEN